MNLNWLDIVILIILGVSVAEGIAKGFARVGIGFAAAILGIVLGVWFYGLAGYYILPFVSSEGIANFIGFWIVFGVCLVAGALLGKALSLLFKWAGIGWMDRTLGAVFGFLRGLVGAVALVLVMVAFTPNPPPKAVVRSHWSPYLLGVANVCVEFAPKKLKDGFFVSSQKVKEIWSGAVKKAEELPTTTL